MDAVRDKSTEVVVDEAVQWVVRIGAPDVSLEERRAFVAWLKRSPSHLGEYLRVERTWADLGSVDAARRLDVEQLLARSDVNVVELPRNERYAPAELRSWRRPRRSRFTALAASLMLAIAAVFLFQTQFADRYTTGVGEQRTLRLADGSTVVLNTDTQVRVDFTSAFREVRLLEGEALFNVASDRARPFRVLSDTAVAQAVGTSFVVRRHPAQTVVTVLEGQVVVAHSSQADDLSVTNIPPQAVRLFAGARANVAERDIETANVANPTAVTAWKSGRLIFEGETLAAAVAEFNRYNETQIVLQDSVLSEERLSGVFDADQPQALVRFLERSGAIEPAQMSDKTIILVPQR